MASGWWSEGRGFESLATFDPRLPQNAKKIWKLKNDLKPGLKVSDMINFARHSRKKHYLAFVKCSLSLAKIMKNNYELCVRSTISILILWINTSLRLAEFEIKKFNKTLGFWIWSNGFQIKTIFSFQKLCSKTRAVLIFKTQRLIFLVLMLKGLKLEERIRGQLKV